MDKLASAKNFVDLYKSIGAAALGNSILWGKKTYKAPKGYGGRSSRVSYGYRSRRRRYNRKRKSYRTKTSYRKFYKRRKACNLATICRQFKTVKERSAVGLGIMHHRATDVDAIVNTTNYNSLERDQYALISPSIIEAFFPRLKRYDNTTGAFTSENLATLGQPTGIQIKNVVCSAVVKNNYQTDAYVRAYFVKPRTDTNDSPTSTIASGFTDAYITDNNSPLCYPTYSKIFNERFKIISSKKMILPAGGQINLKATIPDFKYWMAAYDDEANTYEKDNSVILLVELHGNVCHDTVADEQSLNHCGVDVHYKLSCDVHYDAGVNIEFYDLVDNVNETITNVGAECSKPAADVQAFSRS